MKYAWVHAKRDSYPVEASCRALDVSRSGYYAWLKREPSKQATRREKIAAAAAESHADAKGAYGYRRVQEDLAENPETACCPETVRSVMRELGLQGKHKRRYVCTTDSNHDGPVAPNLLQRDFTATGPDQKWVADITCIPTSEGWVYLAVVQDCFSRRIVGWAMSERIDAELVCEAFQMAVQTRQPQAEVIHHSDRGVQYTAGAFRALAAGAGVALSMSAKGSPWDNAMAESFFASLKTEEADGVYATRAEARMALFEYIELFYNRRRRHSSLGYVSPDRYERLYEAGELATDKPAA